MMLRVSASLGVFVLLYWSDFTKYKAKPFTSQGIQSSVHWNFVRASFHFAQFVCMTHVYWWLQCKTASGVKERHVVFKHRDTCGHSTWFPGTKSIAFPTSSEIPVLFSYLKALSQAGTLLDGVKLLICLDHDRLFWLAAAALMCNSRTRIKIPKAAVGFSKVPHELRSAWICTKCYWLHHFNWPPWLTWLWYHTRP